MDHTSTATDPGLTPETEAIGTTMRAAWASCAHGRPPGDGRLEWPAYGSGRTTRIFGSNDRVENDPLKHERELWNGR